MKTRLTPPFTPVESAALAEAALHDTLCAVAATPSARRVAVLDGPSGSWLPAGIEPAAQSGGALGTRLAAAFQLAAAGDPTLLIGMDTPQVTPALLCDALDRLAGRGVDAVLGPADDGGFWAIGMRRPRLDAFAGVPMSRPTTGWAQGARLAAIGLRTAALPTLTDVDDASSAARVAAVAPHTRFARQWASLVQAMSA